MIKFEFGNGDYYFYDNCPPIEVDAPSVNLAIIKLAMEHDLSNFTAIYMKTIGEEEEEDD